MTLVLSLPSHKKTHQLCLAAAVLIPAQIPPELHLLSAGLPKVVTCLNLQYLKQYDEIIVFVAKIFCVAPWILLFPKGA